MNLDTPTSTSTYSRAEVQFKYEGQSIAFRSVATEDHILRVMQTHRTFYEQDVLEKLRERLSRRQGAGAAVDAGAFIGSHSIYFAKFCGLKPVLAFEANPNTFPCLLQNIDMNQATGTVIPMNKALGSGPGYAKVIPGDNTNQGHSSVAFNAGQTSESVRVSAIDDEVEAALGTTRRVALIKIDVEGAELEVLNGAKRTIRACRPVLCIEVHNFKNLRKVLIALRGEQYWIVDCLGYSPTYVMEATDSVLPRRFLVNLLWLVRAAIPAQPHKLSILARQHLRRLAQTLSA